MTPQQQQAIHDQWRGDTNGEFQQRNPQGTAHHSKRLKDSKFVPLSELVRQICDSQIGALYGLPTTQPGSRFARSASTASGVSGRSGAVQPPYAGASPTTSMTWPGQGFSPLSAQSNVPRIQTEPSLESPTAQDPFQGPDLTNPNATTVHHRAAQYDLANYVQRVAASVAILGKVPQQPQSMQQTMQQTMKQQQQQQQVYTQQQIMQMKQHSKAQSITAQGSQMTPDRYRQAMATARQQRLQNQNNNIGRAQTNGTGNDMEESFDVLKRGDEPTGRFAPNTEQQNNLERRLQEDQYLMACQREQLLQLIQGQSTPPESWIPSDYYKATEIKKPDAANMSKASSGGSLTIEAKVTRRGPPQGQPAEIGRDTALPLSSRVRLKRQMNQAVPQDITEVYSERSKKMCVSYTISEDMLGDYRNKILSRIIKKKRDNRRENFSYAESWSLKTLAGERLDNNRDVASSSTTSDRVRRPREVGLTQLHV